MANNLPSVNTGTVESFEVKVASLFVTSKKVAPLIRVYPLGSSALAFLNNLSFNEIADSDLIFSTAFETGNREISKSNIVLASSLVCVNSNFNRTGNSNSIFNTCPGHGDRIFDPKYHTGRIFKPCIDD